eukprot:TRINITY_DN4931_c0_g1_i1.p1 TRINITY_DN4931_c0_g1~~TRINITY_DN4931_c0_g1_i1.p1  ORF type:complete len:389 (+),score=76.20 TRINITY_DN4931_c0_g1_i1:38-1168(+)
MADLVVPMSECLKIVSAADFVKNLSALLHPIDSEAPIMKSNRFYASSKAGKPASGWSRGRTSSDRRSMKKKSGRGSLSTRKNAPRRTWSIELHRHFVVAWTSIARSGIQPSPKKIMTTMAANGAPMSDLTIRQVQSHHQKYKLKMAKQRAELVGDISTLGSPAAAYSLRTSVSLDSAEPDAAWDDDEDWLDGTMLGASESVESVISDWQEAQDSGAETWLSGESESDASSPSALGTPGWLGRSVSVDSALTGSWPTMRCFSLDSVSSTCDDIEIEFNLDLNLDLDANLSVTGSRFLDAADLLRPLTAEDCLPPLPVLDTLEGCLPLLPPVHESLRLSSDVTPTLRTSLRSSNRMTDSACWRFVEAAINADCLESLA